MKIAMVLMRRKWHTKDGNKKLSRHCNNALVTKKVEGIVYSVRWVYISDFHDVHLLNAKNVQKLISMCRFTKPNVLFCDVVKRLTNLRFEPKGKNI